MKTLLIIPTKNAYSTILEIISQIKISAPTIKYLIVDYGSTDKTKFLLINNNIPHLSFPLESSYGDAMSLGFRYAFENKYDEVIEWNQNGRFNAEDINHLISAYRTSQKDFILGSRFVKNKANFKYFAANSLRRAIKLATWASVKDPNLKLRLYGKRVIKVLSSLKYLYSGPDTIAHLIKAKYTFKQIQVRINENIKINNDKGIIYVIKNILFILFIKPIKRGNK